MIVAPWVFGAFWSSRALGANPWGVNPWGGQSLGGRSLGVDALAMTARGKMACLGVDCPP